MRHALHALLVLPLFAASTSADMSFPLHKRVPARTTVTLEKPIPGYAFYAASMFEGGRIIRLQFDPNLSVEVPHLADRMILYAVPEAVAERCASPEAVRKEIRENRPEGVYSRYYDAFFDDFTLDTHRDDRLHIVIREGQSGIELETVHWPQATGSRWVCSFTGLLLSALAIFLGIRWARRRKA